jgi:magnesium-transporting ATPase (P-type)
MEPTAAEAGAGVGSLRDPAAHVLTMASVRARGGIERATSIVFLPTTAADQTMAAHLYVAAPLAEGAAEGGPEASRASAPPPPHTVPALLSGAEGDRPSGILGESLLTTFLRWRASGSLGKAAAWLARLRPGAPAPPPQAEEAAARPAPATEYVCDEHMLSLAALAERYGTALDLDRPTSSGGLTPEEAATRLATHGQNVLTPPKTVPEWVKFARQFSNLLMVLLLIAAGLAFLAYGLLQTGSPTEQSSATDNVVIGGALITIVVFSCTMSYWQERQASDVIASIQGMLPSLAKVVRGGAEARRPVAEIVPGDIVHLTIGDRVPADMRVIAAQDCKVETSALTGESDAIEVGVDRKSDLPAESRALVFNSCQVMQGSMHGLVFRTGDATMIGQINHLCGASGRGSRKTTMEVEVHRLVVFVTIAAVSTALVFFILGLSRGFGIAFSIANAFILVLVANVPEGLPATITSILTLSAQLLASHNVFIKRTDLIETLGCASVICSDKTGTLTQNKMSVSQLWVEGVVVNALEDVERVHGPRRGRLAPPRAAAPPAPPRDIASEMAIGRALTMVDRDMLIHSTTRRWREPGSPPTHRPTVAADQTLGPDVLPGPRTADRPPSPTILRHGTIAVHARIAGIGLGGLPSPLEETGGEVSEGPSEASPTNTDGRLEGGPEGGTIGSLAQGRSVRGHRAVATFQSFRSFAYASWGESNAFTRLVTIAAVCNKARFSAPEGDETATVTVPPAAAPADDVEEEERIPCTVGAGGLPMGPSMRPATLQAILAQRPPKAEAPPGAADTRRVLGDASEAALLRYADSLLPAHVYQDAYRVLWELPFNSTTKMAFAIAAVPEDTDTHVVLAKGAPERILERCTLFLQGDEERPIDDQFRASWNAAYERFGLSGERVLAFAYRVYAAPPGAPGCYTDEASRPMDSLVFCGLTSLVDPPKVGVAEAIARCRGASIRVTMVTGDHPLTAEAIARKVGIITQQTARQVAAAAGVEEGSIAYDDERVGAIVLPGYTLPTLEEADWDVILAKREVVFARTTPQQKLEIVQHYQRLGHVVAVTGDGVNDAPALKVADIGVSMGSAAASDVAREAGDMVLMDDNFASIVVAIECGRTVFYNIRKCIAYTVTHALPELLPIFVLLLLDVPLMLPGLLVLCCDLLTEQWPATSLAYEPSEHAVMLRPPRDLKRDRLVDGRLIFYSYGVIGILEFLACTMAFFLTAQAYGIPGYALLNRRDSWTSSSSPIAVGGRVYTGPEQETIVRRSVAGYFLTLILCQAVHVFLCKTSVESVFVHGPFRNMQTVYGVAVAVAIGCIAVYVPAINSFFDAGPAIWPAWTCFFAFAAIAIPYTELSKAAARRHPTSWWARNVQW